MAHGIMNFKRIFSCPHQMQRSLSF